MFIQLTVEEIKDLKSKKLIQQISRWQTLDKARSFYSTIDGVFTGYKENIKELESAYSTPVVVFKIKNCRQSSRQ